MHGLYGSSSNWRRIAKALSDTYRVISVDLRNHGASPWAATMSYEEMAADVAALVNKLSFGAPAILGHSMGATISLRYALVHQPDDSRAARSGEAGSRAGATPEGVDSAAPA